MIKETYSYLWSVLIKARNSGIKPTEVAFRESKDISPYLELNLEDINFKDIKKEDGKYIIDVNPYIRFTNSFVYLCDINYKKAKRFRESIANIFLHFMGSLDIYEGRSKREYYLELMVEEVEKEVYGVEVTQLFHNFLDFEKYRIVEVLYDLYSFENRMEAYKRAIKSIFSDSIIYDNSFSDSVLVVYINAEKNEINEKKLKCINLLFLPLWLEIRVFWAYHFGVVGVPMTMRVGNIAIY